MSSMMLKIKLKTFTCQEWYKPVKMLLHLRTMWKKGQKGEMLEIKMFNQILFC